MLAVMWLRLNDNDKSEAVEKLQVVDRVLLQVSSLCEGCARLMPVLVFGRGRAISCAAQEVKAAANK